MKKNKLQISQSSLDDLIWMSYRYCIGSHTIAAAHHADTIKNVIQQNKDAFSGDRLKFYARDIRDCINSILHWRDDISIEGFANNWDTYSALLYEVSKHDNPQELKFTIDTYNKTIYTDPLGKENKCSSDYDYHDFIRWVKLANWLDDSCHRIVVTNFKGKVEEHICFSYPIRIGNKYKQVWSELDSSLGIDLYITNEYITEIKEL